MSLELTQCIVTKIAHDVAGASGAVLNTVELLNINPADGAETVKLLADSADTLIVRMKFFRCVFGTKTDVSSEIGKRYLATLSQKITVSGAFKSAIDLAFAALAGECLVKGGNIILGAGRVVLSGAVVKMPDEIVEALTKGAGAVTPHNCIAFWIYEMAVQKGRRIEVRIIESGVEISVI